MMWMMNQNKLRMQNLDKMCCMLMKDIGESYAIPADLKGKQQMLRGLMNLRYPIAMNADFLTLQDKELQMQRKEKGEVSVGDISKDDAALILWQGDITRLRVDAIVNAANSQMLGCFQPLHSCIDNAIHSAAGIQLRDACNRMMMKQGHPETKARQRLLPDSICLHDTSSIRWDQSFQMESLPGSNVPNWLRAIMNVYSWQSETAWSPLPSAAFPPAFSAFPTSWLQKSPSGK